MSMQGRAWKFGDKVSTDLIAPGRYAYLRSNLPELARHVLEDARKEYVAGVKPGDFVVAGRNFGQGSSREHAAIIIKLSGCAAVIAKSFARIFFRNAINIGLPAIILDTGRIKDGDKLDVDLEAGKVRNLTRDEEYPFPPLPAAMTRILEDGGLIAHVIKHKGLEID
jgi:3-isopropylmalate/(R)-2-methylmalate dehydratase small subunit